MKFATFQGFLFSVNSFCCYCLRVLYFLLFFFVYFHIFFFSSSISLFSFSFFLFCCCCSYFFGIVESKRQKGTEVGLAYISWFSGTETAKSKKNKKKKKTSKRILPFSFFAGFPRCCYVPASSLTSSAKTLCVLTLL